MGVGDEVAMVVENAEMVVQSEDIEMAGDVITFVEQILPMATEVSAACGGGAAPAPAPAPAEGGAAPTPAPTEGGAAPAPAEGGATPAPQ
jgi:cytochrome c